MASFGRRPARRPRVVLFGAGMVARLHASACQALEWPITAVASRSPARATALADDLGAPTATFDDLAATRLGDVAIVATPPTRHVDDAIALLDSGYHVVVEAPLACTLTGADRLIAAEERVGRPVLYSEHLVSAPAIDTMLARVTSIGALTHLSARAIQSPPSWRANDHHTWGGGALFDLGVHPIGLALRTASEAGAGAPTSVTTVISDAGTEREHATVKLHFESGLLATVIVGWQRGATPDWDLQASSAGGVLRVDLYPEPALQQNGDPVPVPSTLNAPEHALAEHYGYAGQLRRFWTNIRTGRPVPATSRLGRQVLDVIAAAHWSAGRNASASVLPFTGPREQTPSELFG